MRIICKAIVIKERKEFKSTIYDLDNVTSWRFIDTPYFSGIDKEVTVCKESNSTFITFENSTEKFAVDEM